MRILPPKTSIRVNAKHWLRANSSGVIEHFDPERSRYLVRFDHAKLGCGFDGGQYLYLQDIDFETIDDN